MPKTDIRKIIKAGSDVRFENTDYSKKTSQKELDELKKRQDSIVKREDVDWQQLSNFRVKL